MIISSTGDRPSSTFFARELSHKIREAYKYKVFEKKQAPTTNAPFGYKWDKNIKQYIIDKKHEPTIRKIFEVYDSGSFSIDQLREYCNSNGLLPKSGKNWSPASMQRFLKNPFYAGWFSFKGGVYEGSHEPYFPKSVFEQRLARLSANRYGQISGNRTQLLSRFIRCSTCGVAYIAETQSGAHNSGTYVYYRHKCRGQKKTHRIKEADVLRGTENLIEEGRFSQLFVTRLKELFRTT